MDGNPIRNPGLPDWLESSGLHITEDYGDYLEISLESLTGKQRTAKVTIRNQHIKIEWDDKVEEPSTMEDSCLIYDAVKELFHNHITHDGHRMLTPVQADRLEFATPAIGENIIRMCLDRRWFMENTTDMALLSVKYKECSGLLDYGRTYIDRFENEFDRRRHGETIDSLDSQLDRIYSAARDCITVDLTKHTVKMSDHTMVLTYIVVAMTWTTIVSSLVAMKDDLISASP